MARPGKMPVCSEATTGKRILELPDTTPPAGYGRWTGPLLARNSHSQCLQGLNNQ